MASMAVRVSWKPGAAHAGSGPSLRWCVARHSKCARTVGLRSRSRVARRDKRERRVLEGKGGQALVSCSIMACKGVESDGTTAQRGCL
jgi:hypothetical protein